MVEEVDQYGLQSCFLVSDWNKQEEKLRGAVYLGVRCQCRP